MAAIALASCIGLASVASASAETRSLKLYFTHTGERAEITFKRNGKYVRSGLNKLNRFLRDHRRNEPTKMDPKLFDLIWEAYRKTGSREYIHVVSAYRSPQTNAMLRRTRGGQATKSQHMLGKAMDFFIPGVSAKKLREIGFKLQGGGVGYYPRSNTPYVHFDTAGVRAWPRMSRAELTRLFPNGRTLHIPPDGKPLPGYQQALADYKRRQARGQVAAVIDDDRGSSNSGGLLSRVLRGGSGRNNDSSAPSRPSAPVAPQTPETLLAALPSSQLPTPQIAPRVSAGVPVAITPSAPVPVVPVETPTQPAAVPSEAQPTTFAFAPPIPQRRPSVLVAAAPSPSDRRSAAEIEAALNAPATEIAAAPANAAQTRDDAQAILEALGADRPDVATTAPPVQLAYASLPNPQARPNGLGLAEAVAATPVQLAPLPQAAPDGRGSRIIVPSERPVGLDPQSAQDIRTAALDTGVATTPKAPKPTQTDAIQVAALPVASAPLPTQINPARFGTWATTAAPITTSATPTTKPDFAQNAIRQAPDVVYTAGFEKTSTPDPNRFTGNAITFLAVAKFEGGTQAGGDGQPLQIKVPSTQ
ncbi:MAG: DUF882 domain-containing protein [Pseudomonadota bacterium]